MLEDMSKYNPYKNELYETVEKNKFRVMLLIKKVKAKIKRKVINGNRKRETY